MPWLAVAAALAAAIGLGLWRWRRSRGPVDGKTDARGVPASSRERLRRGLAATSGRFVIQLTAALGRSSDLEEQLRALEEVLLLADVGAPTTASLLEGVRRRVGRNPDAGTVRRALQNEMVTLLTSPPAPEPASRPWVILVAGVNGVGKTTTIGKLAARFGAEGKRVLLVAGDTFRAAAADQLAVWAERSGADLVRQAEGADPAAVVFDGMKAAQARGVDVVLVDTAGRLHTRTNLVEELRKIQRVIAREVPGAPHETLLVVDATTGQNALAQARTFRDAVHVGGVALTKLDGTARGGVVLAVRRELELPIRYVGVGEAVDDLRPFAAAEFVSELFGDECLTDGEDAH